MHSSHPEQKISEPTPSEHPKFRKKLAGLLMLFTSFGILGDVYQPDEMQFNHKNSANIELENLQVMTANVHGWQGSDGYNFHKFRSVLRQEKPDLVCMQEVLADGEELGKLYEDGYNVLFSTTIRYPFRGRFGNAVLSKAPMKLVDVVELSNPKTRTPRNGILFSINDGDNKIDFLNTHLSYNSSESAHQITQAFRQVGNRVQALCGDLNQIPEIVEAGPFSRMIAIAPRISHSLTFPSHKPNKQIDYVLYDQNCGQTNTNQAKILDIGSDHMALSQVINLQNC